MARNGRRRDADPRGESARGQRDAAEELLEDSRAGAVGEQRGDVGELGHDAQRTPGTFRCRPKRPRAYGRSHDRARSTPRTPFPSQARPGRSARWPGCARRCRRFANGETHARRRAMVEAMLAEIDPDELQHGRAADRRRRRARTGPVAVLAARDRRHDRRPRRPRRRTSARSPPHTGPAPMRPAPTRRSHALIARLPAERRGARAQHVALLVQGCEPMAAMIERQPGPGAGDEARRTPTGDEVEVDLGEHPFGEGPRRCPGERHARSARRTAR